jgi:tetratricopeptide (TPR) repeat protein
LGDKKFRAFISYSHADEQWGAWLQRSLERFRAPKEFAARLKEAGKPFRLAPVFRDREDLPVAGNLNDAIQKALADSEFQIVLCSPNAAKSRWVNEEIKLFTRLHGPGRTFAIVVAGEPGSGGDTECFPPALRFKLDNNGEPTAEPAEPLAADAREVGDGKRVALLKTAAGMLGVGLDDLVRRDARARARRMQAVAAGASAIAASMTFAAVFALNQRDEARRARGEAEDLIEFMLSDLSERLEPVGRLDILEEVGGEVLGYYEEQNLKALDAEALSRRARGLMKLGQVDQRRGDLDAALKAYEAAFASTEEQLRRAPTDPDRIFDHAQSVFYLGDISVARQNLAEGERRFGEYYSLAQRLNEMEPDAARSRLELAYATSNLGAAKFNRGEYEAALKFFVTSAEARKELHQSNVDDRNIAFAYAYALSWRAFAEIAVGWYESAIETITEQLSIYDLFPGSRRDYQVLENSITAQRRLAQTYLGIGNVEASKTAIEQAAALGEMLYAREPDNINSVINISIADRHRSYLMKLSNNPEAELAFARRSVEFARRAASRSENLTTAELSLVGALSRLLAAYPAGSVDEYLELKSLVAASELAGATEFVDVYCSAMLAIVSYERTLGDPAAARDTARAAVKFLSPARSRMTAASRGAFAELLLEAGDLRNAALEADRIWSLGVRSNELAALRQRLAEARPEQGADE